MARPNLVLVGFMGTGKSTVGPLLAGRLGLRYLDVDEEICRRTGRTIEELFRDRAESGFRRIESETVAEISAARGCVISAGGGVVLDSKNMRNLRSGGLVVCLWADPDELWQRISGYSGRPLLAGADPRGVLRSLLRQREPLYRSIRPFVDTTGRSADEVAAEIERIFRDWVDACPTA